MANVLGVLIGGGVDVCVCVLVHLFAQVNFCVHVYVLLSLYNCIYCVWDFLTVFLCEHVFGPGRYF